MPTEEPSHIGLDRETKPRNWFMQNTTSFLISEHASLHYISINSKTSLQTSVCDFKGFSTHAAVCSLKVCSLS